VQPLRTTLLALLLLLAASKRMLLACCSRPVTRDYKDGGFLVRAALVKVQGAAVEDNAAC
jgi:hypothetical protein